MDKFDAAYKLIIEDIIQSVTPEELKDRQKEYYNMRLKLYFDRLINNEQMIKNEDGTYDIFANIDIANNNLTSLTDIPYELNLVDGFFKCSHNMLTDLKGSPKIIHGDFYCYNNNFISLEGFPKEVKRDVWFSMKVDFNFKEEDIRKVCNVGGNVYVKIR